MCFCRGYIMSLRDVGGGVCVVFYQYVVPSGTKIVPVRCGLQWGGSVVIGIVVQTL